MKKTNEVETQKHILSGFLRPWYHSIQDPEKSQQDVFEKLLADYSKTNYGISHHASQIESITEFRLAFPTATYDDFKPLIDKVMAGSFEELLWEEPAGWAITRGTTKGQSKFIPMTPTDISLRISAGRAVMNYAASSGRYDVFTGVNLNLNFPSKVGSISVKNKKLEYGYSSGIYAKYVSNFSPIRSAPAQDEIDALGGGNSIKDWEKRFELAYQNCKDENVTIIGGVLPTAQRFARYLKKNHKIYPKDLWKPQVMTLGSVPGINTKHQPSLNALYGKIVIREIYGATEGMFGQQLDDKRAWVPNYDLFLFEVDTKTGTKMLYEMKPGEMGGLIVSTPVFPRYRIGDLIRAYEPPYFRCIGRERWSTPLVYIWNELSSFNLDQL